MGSISVSDSLDIALQRNGEHSKHCQTRGQRLLPHVVDHDAAENPDSVVGLIAKPSKNGKTPYEFTVLSISLFANAVNYTARWLDSKLGRGSHRTIGFVGLQDFRYAIMEVAAMKTGNVLLLPSSRNALSNTINLMEATNCGVLFYSGAGSPIEDHAKSLQGVMRTSKLQIHAIPSFEEMISSKAPHYPYPNTYQEAKNEVVLILHTSGSTGNPKPINLTHAFIKRADAEHFTPPIKDRIHADLRGLKSPMYCGSPFFHLSGVATMLRALFDHTAVIIGPPDVPSTPKTACDVARSIELKCVMAAPYIIDALFMEHGEELKNHFSKLVNVIWFGGPLAHKTGDWIIAHLPHVNLWQFYGSTEMAWFPMLVAPKSHYSYMEFHPDLGPHFEAVPNTDLHELVIRPHPDPVYSWTTPIFDIFPATKEWRSRDLFKKCQDPGMESLWKFESRVDDILILNTGLKVNPLHIEVKLQSHPVLMGAMVFGEGKMNCGILLEPKQGIEKERLLRRVWEDIEKANGEVPEHARIARHLIVVTDEKRPMVKSPKGSVVRTATRKLYEREIEEVYAMAS